MRMKKLALSSVFALLCLPAIAQDSGIVYGTIEYGVLEPETLDNYDIPLAPGEEVIGIYAVPSIVQVPQNQGVIYETLPYDAAEEIDRVTGLPRNTPGWTGEVEAPAGIGCFPQGVCAHLN